MEKQGMPAVRISLEQATDRTPDSTRFHLFQHDTLIALFETLSKAPHAYHEAIATSGYQLPHAAAAPLHAAERCRPRGTRPAIRRRHAVPVNIPLEFSILKAYNT